MNPRGVLLLLFLFVSARLCAEPLTTEANRMAEVSFESAKTYEDPFNEVTLDAVFTAPDGKTLRVPAFWTGGKVWRVRYASAVTGKHTFRTQCSDPANAALHGVAGEVIVTPYSGTNALFRHGAIRVADDRRHFAYADGTPFFWLGDTWWMGLVKRLQWPEEFQQLTADRRDKGFTVIQIVAGLYPDMPAFDERGLGDAGQPWEKLYAPLGSVERAEKLEMNGLIAASGDPKLDGPVRDPRELVQKLAASDRVRQVFIRHVFRYYLGRNEALADAKTLQDSDRAYVESGGSFKTLLVSLLTSDSFLKRAPMNVAQNRPTANQP